MAELVERLATTCGVSCVAIGAGHALGGLRSVPGAGRANATLDSQERFYGPIFAGYGLAWLRAARRPADLGQLDALSLTMLAGGVARLLSIAERGRPHPLYQALTAVEFAVPGLFLALTRRERRRLTLA